MIVMQSDVDERKKSILLIVLEPDNVERMTKADPITLECAEGFLSPIKYPDSFEVIIAYEPLPGPVYAMIQAGKSAELIPHLFRGYKFTDADGLKAGPLAVLDAGPITQANNELRGNPVVAAWFEQRLNAVLAPVTKAWTKFAVETITVNPGDIKENDLRFTMTVTAKRRK